MMNNSETETDIVITIDKRLDIGHVHSENDFGWCADRLMNHMALNLNGHLYRIVEVEFYLYQDDDEYYKYPHCDVYTHCHPNQHEYGMLYFHRTSRSPDANYKGGTYKGVDITYGGNDPSQYCGCLIRSIADMTDQSIIIEGPCKVVDKMLELYNTINIKHIVGRHGIDVQTYLTVYDHPDQKMIFDSIRVGLNPVKSKEYYNKHYRFLIEPLRIKKLKKLLKDDYVRRLDDDEYMRYFGKKKPKQKKFNIDASDVNDNTDRI